MTDNIKNHKLMATRGNEFVCKNNQCVNFNTGFTIYAQWPITDIDDIINSQAIPEDQKQYLIKSKESGKKYALIPLPNEEGFVAKGKRVQLFCEKDFIIWERDIVESGDIRNNYCDKCKQRLKTSEEARIDGIECPSCGKTLQCNSWFSQDCAN